MRISTIFKNKKVLIAGGVALVVLGVVVFAATRPKAGPSIVGKDQGTVLTDYDGKSVRFDDYTGGFGKRPLVVYFWATWCPYCNEEFSNLAGLNQEYGTHINIMAVNRGEDVTTAKSFTDKLPSQGGILYLLDSNDALFKKLGGYAMPETIFINNRGEEVFHKHGPISKDEIESAAKLMMQ